MDDAAVQLPPDGDPERSRAGGSDRSSEGRIHLSQREVEQVIARAVELQQVREAGLGAGLTLDDLQAVVAQVGVEPDVVRRALDDVRLGLQTPAVDGSLLDRVLGPRQVRGAAVVAGAPEEVARAIATWMTEDEGLLLAGTRDGADRWVPDKRILTQVRHGLQVTRSDSALRGLRHVTSRTSDGAEGTLVSVEADTSAIRTANAAVVTVSGVLGVAAGVVAAVLVPDDAVVASDVAQFVGGLAVPTLAGAGITAIIHQSWLGRVRRAVVQALDGISMTARDGEDAARPPQLDWRTVGRRWFGG